MHALVSAFILRIHGVTAEFPTFLNTSDISFGEDVSIERHCEFGGNIRLSDYVSVGHHSSIHGAVDIARSTRLNPRCEIRGDVNIGRYCAIARDVTFQQQEHDYNYAAIQHPLFERLLDRSSPSGVGGPIRIGSDVWIGKDVLVLPGVTVGHGAVIGAKSIVIDDVEPYAIVVGSPATRKRYRFPLEVRERLLDVRWWEWSEDRIRSHADLFDGPLNSVEDIPDSL